jgi:DeoR family fructose operon transcriptional repressor
MNMRQSELIEFIEKRGRVSIEDIRIHFNVSDMTVRRDLAYLEENGYVTRIRGGVLARRKLFFNSSFNEKRRGHTREKKTIAHVAASVIQPGDKIILDTGTTTLYIAEELAKLDMVITVATTSLAVASVLFNSNIDVLMFGGFLHREIPDLFGPLIERNLQEFRAHTLFIGCDALSYTEGFFTSDLHLSEIERKMVTTADRIIIVADHSKFGQKSFVRYADVTDVHTIITDGLTDREQIAGFRQRGVEVIIAK